MEKTRRILAVVGQTLVALNAKTGARYPGFGVDGEVDLRPIRRSCRGQLTRWGSPPVVVRDVVVMGSNSLRKRTVRLQATSAATTCAPASCYGRFTRRRARRDFGSDTWLNDSWDLSRDSRTSWAPFSADDELGYVYLPLETADAATTTADSHPGNNLFGDSLVCLDAKTGKRVWHFQTVHHGLWDYDLPAAPVLPDITVNGRAIKARRPGLEARVRLRARSRDRPAGLADRRAAGADRATCRASGTRRRSRSPRSRRPSISRA